MRLKFSISLIAACTLTVTSASTAAAGPPSRADANKWAVIIGVEDYAGRTHDTYGGLNDARNFQRVLLQSGWPADHVMVLTDRYATAAHIRAGLAWLANATDDSSYSVVHYSGHIKQRNGDRDSDGEVRDEFLWPSDNRLISDAEFSYMVRSLHGWVWVDIAGCEAAGIDDGISAPNVLFTGSSQEHEKSYEDKQLRQSLSTWLMIERGILRGEADFDRNRVVSIQEAFGLFAREAPRLTARQRKGRQHPYIAGGDGVPWYLAG